MLSKTASQREIKKYYSDEYQSVLDQIQHEKELELDQYWKGKDFDISAEKLNLDIAKYNAEYANGGGGATIKKDTTGNTTINKNNASGNTTSTPKYDTESLKALGLGGKSAAEINKLVLDGYLEEYEENGVIKFRKKGNSAVGNLIGAFKNLFK